MASVTILRPRRPVPTPSIPFPTPLATVALYRGRCRDALVLARRAFQAGDTPAVRGYLDEAIFWRAAAHAWASKGRGPLPHADLGGAHS